MTPGCAQDLRDSFIVGLRVTQLSAHVGLSQPEGIFVFFKPPSGRAEMERCDED
jgi:hypothetical protein